jgi:hypothetical protein
MAERAGMIVAPVRSKTAFADGRIDARYHCSPGVLAGERMGALEAKGAEIKSVGGEGGLGVVGPTSRTKRVYAGPGEESVPYLRPYDVFDYVPQAADALSKTGSYGIEDLIPQPGTILQTCSGRNLGPLTYGDAFISRFVVSDDMLRLYIEAESDRYYTLAFLSTQTGQALLTRNKTGNVIDHLSATDLAAIRVPFLDDETTRPVVSKMKQAVTTRESARIRLHELVLEFEASLPHPTRTARLREGWTLSAARLQGRLDAAFYDPLVAQIREALSYLGGAKVADVAETAMPNRYKRRYVTADYGRSIVSGRQLLQMRPINLQYIAANSVDYETYELREHTVAFGARGRAEDRMAQPALITSDRSEWLASHNVMRVRPKPGISPGWLYLCFASWQVQAQVKAGAFGSVVDVVDPSGIDDVLLPPEDRVRGDQALECWQDLALANAKEAEAVSGLEHALEMRWR